MFIDNYFKLFTYQSEFNEQWGGWPERNKVAIDAGVEIKFLYLFDPSNYLIDFEVGHKKVCITAI